MIVKYFGPPGTGKTTKLRSLVEEDVKKRDMELPRIGYVSFTKGAAEVIRERMHASVEDVKWFRTIHSACMTLAGIGRESVIVAADYRRFREQTGMEIRADDEWDTDELRAAGLHADEARDGACHRDRQTDPRRDPRITAAREPHDAARRAVYREVVCV
jgi:superfamily I DNA/RNA helicase